MFWSIFARSPHNDPKSSLPILPDVDEEGIIDPVLIAQRLRDTPPLAIRIKDTDAELHIPLGLGMYYSPTIRDLAANKWQDPSHAVLPLGNVSVDTVRILSTWMEMGSIRLRPLETLDPVPLTWLTASCDLLWQLWSLADYLNIPTLSAHILEKLDDIFEKSSVCNVATPLTPELFANICNRNNSQKLVELTEATALDFDRFWIAVKKHFISVVVKPPTKAKVDMTVFVPCLAMPTFGQVWLEIIEQLTEVRERQAAQKQAALERSKMQRGEKRKREEVKAESSGVGPISAKKRIIARNEADAMQIDSDDAVSTREQRQQQNQATSDALESQVNQGPQRTST